MDELNDEIFNRGKKRRSEGFRFGLIFRNGVEGFTNDLLEGRGGGFDVIDLEWDESLEQMQLIADRKKEVTVVLYDAEEGGSRFDLFQLFGTPSDLHVESLHCIAFSLALNISLTFLTILTFSSWRGTRNRWPT